MSAGIYQILNLVNSDCYIGKTTDLQHRLSAHKSMLKNKVHPNRHLQRAWNKYGDSVFEFRTVQKLPEEWLARGEGFWANYFKSDKRSDGLALPDYNIEEIDPETGYERHSQETKDKIGNKNRGRKQSQETIKKISASIKGNKNPNFGAKYSDERKKQMSVVRKGRKLTDEHKQKIGNAQRGKPTARSPEGAERLRLASIAARTGMKHTEKTKEQIRLKLLGNTNRRGKPISDKGLINLRATRRRRKVVSVHLFSLEMEFFPSLKNAGDDPRFNSRSISAVLSGERTKHKDRVWFYEEDISLNGEK